MVDIYSRYDGDLRCSVTHGPSGSVIATDAPKDNQGRGEAFSPTDLVASALGTCMLTVMGIHARKHNLQIEGTTAHVKKLMTTTAPRRIARLETTIKVPAEISARLDAQAREELERVAHTCPVCHSLAESIESQVQFQWGT